MREARRAGTQLATSYLEQTMMSSPTSDSSRNRFWQQMRHGVAVLVADPTPDKLLGTRDGFRRFFHQRFDPGMPVTVVPSKPTSELRGLPDSDRLALSRSIESVRALERRHREEYHFFAATEGGLHEVVVDGEARYFVRNWTAICGAPGEAVGGGGSVQIPNRLIEGLGSDQISMAVPGKRRRGGMISSLTGGLENRRRSTALSTIQALSTLFYGILDTRAAGTRA